MKVLIVDNYDSFSYNLLHGVKQVCGKDNIIDIIKNDKIVLEEVNYYDKIILSPGPGIPQQARQLLDIIKIYSVSKSILGICLGFQAIGVNFGGQLQNTQKVYHGIQSRVNIISRNYLFQELPDQIIVGHYHSWILMKENLPSSIEITGIDDQEGFIMSISHKEYDVHGLLFHPESILTPYGINILRNFLLQ